MRARFRDHNPFDTEHKNFLHDHFYFLVKFFNDENVDVGTMLMEQVDKWLTFIGKRLKDQGLLTWSSNQQLDEYEVLTAAREELAHQAFQALEDAQNCKEFNPLDLQEFVCFPPYEELKNINISLIQFFHNYTILILTMIIVFIIITLVKKYLSKFTNTKLLARENLELIWTFFPIAILLFIAIPSLKFLYFIDRRSAPIFTLKIFGAQWYWIYQLGDFENFSLNSYILKDDQLLEHERNFMYGWRLLEADVRGILPFSTEVRTLISSQDVIHSFSIPGLGIKVDAVPGRLNWTSLWNYLPGSVYGQCSEICGIGHSFIPVIIEFTCLKDFFKTVRIPRWQYN